MDWIVEHDRVAGETPAVENLRRIQVMLFADPFVVGGVELEIDDIVEDAEEIAVIMAIDAEADAAWMAGVGLVDDGLYIVLVVDAVVFAFVAFMGEADAWIRRGFDGVAEPFELFRRNPVSFVVELVVVAAGEVDVFPVVLEIVGVQDDETEAVFVEVIISAFHAIALEGDFVWIAVVVMVANRMVCRNLEIVVVVDVVDAFKWRVGEIAAMDDEIDVLPFRVGEDAVEPFPRVAREHAWIIMDVSESAEFNGLHNGGLELEQVDECVGELLHAEGVGMVDGVHHKAGVGDALPPETAIAHGRIR